MALRLTYSVKQRIAYLVIVHALCLSGCSNAGCNYRSSDPLELHAQCRKFLRRETVACFVNFLLHFWKPCRSPGPACIFYTELSRLFRRGGGQRPHVLSSAEGRKIWSHATDWLWDRCGTVSLSPIIRTRYAAVTTTIRLRFDGRSTAYQRSLRSQWRNPLAAVTLTYLFI